MNTRLIQQLAPYVSTYDSLKKANSKDSKKSVNAAQLTTSQQQTIADAMQLWSEYKDSPEGQAFLESVKSMDLDEIYDSLQQLSLGPVMTAIKDLVGAALDYSIIPNSFSIGLNFQIELIIGLDITIGVAFGIGDSEGLSSSEWLSIGLTEGVDEGGELDLQFGLWESAPSDLGGFSLSSAATGGVGAEVGAAVVYNLLDPPQIQGVTMGLGVGEEDGVDEEESYTFILGTQSIEKSDDPYLHSTYQAPKANLLILKSLVCDKQRSTPSGNDEVYFHFFTADKDKSFSYNDDDLDNSDINGQVYFFPPYDYYSMDHNDNHAWHTWNCGRSIWFDSGEKVVIHLFDDTSKNQSTKYPMVEFEVSLDDLTLNENLTFHSDKENGAKYSATIRLVHQS